MIRPTPLARTVAALCGLLLVFGLAAPAAHASEFGSDPSATAVESCDLFHSPRDFTAGQWHVHLANSNFGKVAAHFEVTVDQQPPQTADLDPDNEKDLLFSGFDGLPSHVVVTADGKTLVDKTTTLHCNAPHADVSFSCKGPWPKATVDSVDYGIGNTSDVPTTFVVHHADGSETIHVLHSLMGASLALHDIVTEGQHYDVWITIDGLEAKHLTGDVDCEPDPPVIPQGPPPVTPPPPAADPPPATVPPTTVAHSEAVQPALPRTGVATVPLTIAGFVLIGLGSLLQAAKRRRLRSL